MRLPSVWLASALALAAFGCPDRTEAAGLALPSFAARDGIVPAQASPAPDRKAKPKTKKRKVTCGGPGLAPCPK
jgi:hypothetical protein